MKQNELTKSEKSKYAKKIARKLGRGAVSHGWMWWLDRRQDQPPVARTTKADIDARAKEGAARNAMEHQIG